MPYVFAVVALVSAFIAGMLVEKWIALRTETERDAAIRDYAEAMRLHRATEQVLRGLVNN